ncbi:MAG: NADH-quinone oxidoreductase subunit J [Chloroflexi bacterium]|nr:NADH-quinone oxidoreductase subunit J [Chloroflexota bacterium]
MIDTLFFALVAAVAVVAAVAMVVARRAVHSALFLVVILFCVALLYLTLSAEFLAAVQIIVYAGAVMVLFLFVITLLNPAAEQQLADVRSHGIVAAVLAGVLLIEVAAVLRWGTLAGQPASFPPPAVPWSDNVQAIGEGLFTTGFLLPFELTSVLLIVAIVGATVLAKRRL